MAVAVNSTVENIGARRLQTVMERVLDEISFAAPDRNGETIQIDADYVQKHVGDLAKNADLSRFILVGFAAKIVVPAKAGTNNHRCAVAGSDGGSQLSQTRKPVVIGPGSREVYHRARDSRDPLAWPGRR